MNTATPHATTDRSGTGRAATTAFRLALALALAWPPVTAAAHQVSGSPPSPTPPAATGAGHEPELPDTPPPPGTPKDLRLPRATHKTLPNGLRVTLVPYSRVPKVLVSVWLDAGNVYEQPDQLWLADLTGRLLQQGTQALDAAAVAESAARMGGSLGVSVGSDRVAVGGDVLSEFAPDMLHLVADVLRRPRLPQAELARLKTDLKRQIAVERADSQALAHEKFRALLYGRHPYGRMYPTPEQIEALTLEQVRTFHRAHYSAARAHLYVVGVFDAAAVEAAAQAALGGWERGAAAPPPPPTPRSERAVHIVDRPGAVQSTLRVGLPVIPPSHPDWLALDVTHTLLGGYFSSRITTNIREDKGYTYSPGSVLSSRHHDAYWLEEADVATAVTGAALGEILAEIERLRAEPPSEQELEGVKRYVTGLFVRHNASRGAIVSQLDFVEDQGLPADYLERYVSRVQALTPRDIQEMARRHLDSRKMTIVVVGDRQAIAAQLAPFGAARE